MLRLGVDAEAIPFFRRKKSEHELRLLQIATLREKKGHIYTVRSFADALETCPNMSLTIVGSNEHNGVKEEIDRFIDENGISKKVTLMDWIDFSRLHEFMKEYHVFIHPSCYSKERDCEGGAPIVLLDAQATGMPVISTTHCDIPDEVIDCETGLLTPEKDVEALSNSISSFYRMNQLEYGSFAENARSHVLEKYNIRINSAYLRRAYEQVASATQAL